MRTRSCYIIHCTEVCFSQSLTLSCWEKGISGCEGGVVSLMSRHGRISLASALLSATIWKCILGKTPGWLQLVNRQHSAFWMDLGKGYVRMGAGKELSSDSCHGCQEPCASIFPSSFFSNLTKWIFFLDGKWLQWLSLLIFIELTFHWPLFHYETYFITRWNVGLNVPPSQPCSCMPLPHPVYFYMYGRLKKEPQWRVQHRALCIVVWVV